MGVVGDWKKDLFEREKLLGLTSYPEGNQRGRASGSWRRIEGRTKSKIGLWVEVVYVPNAKMGRKV